MNRTKLKNLIKNIIFYSTIVSLFTEAARLLPQDNPLNIDLKLFYGIIIMNFFLLLSISSFRIPWKHILSLILLLTHSLLCLYIFSTTTIPNILKQFIGIATISIYYNLFFQINDFSIRKCIRYYIIFAVLLAIVGYPKFIYDFIQLQTDARFYSIMLEPAHYCLITIPALYILLNEKGLLKNQSIYTLVIFFSLILSFSLVGYVGITLVLLFSIRLSLKRILLGLSIISLIVYLAYYYIEFITIRVDDTLLMFLYQDSYTLHQSNLSTVAFFTNYFVAIQSFLEHPILGGGLGSHQLLYEATIDQIYYGANIYYLNSQDAASFFLRILSETGLLGIVVIFGFMYYFRKGKNSVIQKGIIIYFILKLIRDGHYFPPEFLFFVFIYIKNKYRLGNGPDQKVLLENESNISRGKQI